MPAINCIGPHVFLWAGLDQGSLRNHSRGVRDRTGKLKERLDLRSCTSVDDAIT
jgi:hypothetical protein